MISKLSSLLSIMIGTASSFEEETSDGRQSLGRLFGRALMLDMVVFWASGSFPIVAGPLLVVDGLLVVVTVVVVVVVDVVVVVVVVVGT